MSSGEQIILSCPLALRVRVAAPPAARVVNCLLVIFIVFLLKRVGPVRADTELKLEEQLIGVAQTLIVAVAELRTNLAELAGPVGDEKGLLLVVSRRAEEAIGLVDPHPCE